MRMCRKTNENSQVRPNNSLVIQQNQGILVPPRAADKSSLYGAVLYVWKPYQVREVNYSMTRL